ncbi:MAG: carbohydrate ABC transporter permease [Lachnospirales bacterium]
MNKHELKNYLYVLPAAILVTVFFITSVFYTFYLSFYEWDGFNEKIFVGISNYIEIFNDSNFWLSLGNTLVWVFSAIVVNVAFPLIMAILIINSSRSSLFKNLFYYPATISGTVAGLIMAAMLSAYGLPQIFTLVGKSEWARDVMAIPYLNTMVMILMGTWQGIGLNLLLFISGLRSLDKSPIEAAQVEGASKFKLYQKVVLPALKPTVVVVLLMAIVNSFKVFDSIWVMTKGGPYRTSETLALKMYTESFINSSYGTGSAVAIILTVIILFASYFNLKNTFKKD